ncbi:exonuclease domain-containing protein [Pseudoalteromonas sp. A757]|uniref:exonuclease domain-containing protein n=1 Tax=Pseudoalteromonas sp. A757 TaxID=2250709 RepID=UPI000FFE98DB|nr:exonuclease domain-containing protein [Pseudoalteromonas sp. A757]RXE87664.1 DNA polymerase III subunit epsilon [Pseudoalteromonas sp. A757]
MLRKELPAKYYLSHFSELSDYLLKVCQPLLSRAQRELLAELHRLPEDELCLLVRFISRKTPFLDINSLRYEEINNICEVALSLKAKGFLRQVQQDDFQILLHCLTKPCLIELAERENVTKTPSKSAKKLLWVEHLHHSICVEHVNVQEYLSKYLTLSFQADIDYFLFLYFGKVGLSLAQFSMRDLGVMETRSANAAYHAHFEQRSEAVSAFYYANALSELKNTPEDELVQRASEAIAQQLPKVDGQYSVTANAKYLLTLARKLGPDSNHYSALLRMSEHPQAREILIRHHYKQGEVELVREQLERILQGENDETLMIFAEDFYQRKFNQKRTSVLTDMLRKSQPAIQIDEAFKGQTEAGVIAYYKRHGIKAYHVENKIWLALFGLTFWQELFYHPRSIVANGFSKTPLALKENRFYSEFEKEIECRLASFTDTSAWMNWLLRQMSEHYGEPNRLFIWHDRMLDAIKILLSNVSIEDVKSVLRLMCSDFHLMKSGFPDLMIVDEKAGLRFEEIKAPGDSLSRSQLVNISKLLQCNIPARLQTVEWHISKEQPYVVVDIETTGGSKEFDRITEIAMVKVVNGEVVAKWQSLINPMRRIPQKITELTGITQAMVSDAPRFCEIVEQVEQFSQGAIFVAHNVNFDYGFIRQEFARVDQEFTRAKLCTVQLGRKFVPGLRSYALGAFCQAMNVPLVNHHRAMDDAYATAEIFIQINKIRQEN